MVKFTYTAKEAKKASAMHNKEIEARELALYLSSVNEAIVNATKRGATQIPLPNHYRFTTQAISAVEALGYKVIYPDNYYPVITWE